jgi:predicted transposase YbfD/YdcC
MEPRNDLLACLSIVRDPRVVSRSKHNLIDILVITICAVICGADSWDEIEEFGEAHEEWFKDFLELPSGIPSHDTFARVLSLLDTEELQASFVEWVRGILRAGIKRHVALDGKTIRRSGDGKHGKSAVHMLQALATEEGMLIGQRETCEKSNEITAIPELLKVLALEGCIVTIDAIGCQKDIAKAIRKKKSDYVLAVKENQHELYGDIKLYLGEQAGNGFKHARHDYYETSEKGHGREENRKYWITESIGWLNSLKSWDGLKSIGMAESTRIIDGKETRERRYYITSLKADAQEFGRSVRNHWRIENSCHWLLDVCFREDECRKRVRRSAQNFAVIRRIALNVLKRDQTTKRSIRGKRKRAGWDYEFFRTLVSQF